LNTIEDLLIAVEGKLLGGIDDKIQAMIGNQLPRTSMAMPPMVNMAAPFMPSLHHQLQLHFNPRASTRTKPATGKPVVFHFHPGMMVRAWLAT
jgi:hypothetical protein